MLLIKVYVLILTVTVFIHCEDDNLRGAQIRLTEKGMHYVVDVGINILKDDLMKNPINEKGKSGNLQYNLQNLQVTKAEFGKYELTPVSGVGMRGVVSGISINANGNLWYKYKKNWLVKISDTIGISLETENIYVDMTVNLGTDKTGRPTIALQSCSAGVSKINIHFHGGASWLYNLFSGIIENKLKDKFGNLLCSMAKEEINNRAKSELETFPVVKKIDSYAEIEYGLTHAPTFTADYMDAYLKGEFKASKNPVESTLRIPKFTVAPDHTKMLYFWISDYTLNTAAEVYHKAGRLQDSFAAWDGKVSSELKNMLTTEKFAIIFPKIVTMYPGRPMSVTIKSYQAPKVLIQNGKLSMLLYALASFQVQDNNLKIQDAFTLKLDVTASGSVEVINDKLSGKMDDFDYGTQVVKTNVGKSIISLDSRFLKLIIERTVINKANPFLQKGFPLPKIDEVSLQNFEIQLQNNVIRIGSDIIYVKEE